MGTEGLHGPEGLGAGVGHLDRGPLEVQGHGHEVGDALLVVHHQDAVPGRGHRHRRLTDRSASIARLRAIPPW